MFDGLANVPTKLNYFNRGATFRIFPGLLDMRKIIAMIWVAFISLTAAAQISHLKVPTDNPIQTSFDSLVHTSASRFMKDSARVGISIGIIKDGKQYYYNYGSTKKDGSETPTSSTVYELASIGKTFSATLLARAVLDKKVKLNDDIRKYLKQDYPNLTYKNTPVTLLNLTNLTSALPNWMPDNKNLFNKVNPDSIPYLLDALHQKYSREQFYLDLHSVKPDTLPGSVARHCNTAAQLLGYIMEVVYEKPFDKLIREQFTDPLGMQSTSILKKGKTPLKMATGYDGKGRVMPYIDWDDLQVAAGIVSSTSDMLKYMAFQLDDKNKAVQLSHQPTFGKVDEGAIAFNWKVSKSPKGTTRISHTGGSLGFSTYMVFYPGRNTGIVLLSNEADQQTQNELINLANSILDL